MKNNFHKIPLFLSVIFFIFSSFAFLYFYREINNNSEKSQLAEIKWQIEMDRRDEIKTLERSVKTIEEERTQLETHFAQSSDIVPFLDTIEGLASKVGAKAEIISVDILEDHTGLMVGMKATGTFSGLYKFLTLLENSPYELEFMRMDMHKGVGLDVGNKNVPVPKWDVTFKIKLLSFVE